MKSIIAIKITCDIEGNGRDVLRRVLAEYVRMIESGEAGLKVPERTQIGTTVVELHSGPASEVAK